MKIFSQIPLLIWRNEVVFPGIEYEFELEDKLQRDTVGLSCEFWFGQIVISPKDPSSSPQSSTFALIGTLCEVVALRRDGSKTLVRIRGLRRVSIFNIGLYEFENETSGVRRLDAIKNIYMSSYTFLPTIITSVNSCRNRFREFVANVISIAYRRLISRYQLFLERMFLDSENFMGNLDLERVIDVFALIAPVDGDAKLAVLYAQHLSDRIEILMKMYWTVPDIQSLIEIFDGEIKRKITSNIQSQQREFYLREKLKAIKDEMGESSLKDGELKRLKDKFESKKFPKKISQKITDELRKLETCNIYSSEANVIRSYLEWVLDLPWMNSIKGQEDLVKVKEIMDINHRGLVKVKNRIIEHMAVRNRSDLHTGEVMCFAGPPGVGKTSLVSSISQALKRPYVKVSLGGVADEADIRGHRKTYVGAMPGRIIKALKQANCNNPIILLDEIDKLGVGYHGDPVHALLEVLDPKQNDKFEDHYIEEEFDLSKVMFIATANTLETIPDPLLDRMEVIDLESYTENEKLEIAKSHLLPEVFKESGLNDELTFTDEAILFVIRRYTKEAGVRNLKQQFFKIARKFVTRQLFEKISSQEIDVQAVRDYLEYELYDHTEIDEQGLPGVVNGMAYTAYGGDLLPIEVNHMPGKGGLSITGNLKETMRESASVALAFVRAHESVFGLTPLNLDWNNIDINLHVPSGGIPKDGPSAGVTITTALISSLSGKIVSPKVAMTGEITLRGKVLPIGGLREKVVSAVRGGIDTIFFPDSNIKNLVDVPEEIRSKISLIPVKHYQDIYDRLFKD